MAESILFLDQLGELTMDNDPTGYSDPHTSRLRSQMISLGNNSGSATEWHLSKVTTPMTGKTHGAWGVTIIRTDYGQPRRQMQDAIACINEAIRRDIGARRPYPVRKVGVPLDVSASKRNRHIWKKSRGAVSVEDELYARYTDETLQSAETLKGADTDIIRRNFQQWIQKKGGDCKGGDVRYIFCIILDADAIVHLNEAWRSPSRVGESESWASEVKVKVLDAVPGASCTGAYELFLRGRYGLVNFCFERRLRRQPLEVFLRAPDTKDGLWSFGPEEDVKAGARHYEPAKQNRQNDASTT